MLIRGFRNDIKSHSVWLLISLVSVPFVSFLAVRELSFRNIVKNSSNDIIPSPSTSACSISFLIRSGDTLFPRSLIKSYKNGAKSRERLKLKMMNISVA